MNAPEVAAVLHRYETHWPHHRLSRYELEALRETLADLGLSETQAALDAMVADRWERYAPTPAEVRAEVFARRPRPVFVAPISTGPPSQIARVSKDRHLAECRAVLEAARARRARSGASDG
jgi:uncharacterized protein YjiS (DUF1127 family)